MTDFHGIWLNNSSSQGIPELRQSISGWYEDNYAVQVSTKEIMIFSEAVHALYCALLAVLNSGNKVIIPEPFWPQYGDILSLSGASVKKIDTSSSEGRLTSTGYEKAISDRSKVLIINNPSNPSGLVHSQKEMEQFIEIAHKRNIFYFSG